MGITDEVETVDINSDIRVSNTCISCNKPTSDAYRCTDCGMVCHAILPSAVTDSPDEEGFGASVICHLCDKKRKMEFERMKRQQDQAELIKDRSVKRFKQAEIGDM